MFKKIKQLVFNLKALIVLLIILIVIGWGLTIYFGIKLGNSKETYADNQSKMEKLNYYSILANKSINLIKNDKSLKELEDDVRLLDNGVLLAEWENAVFTGKKEDAYNYLDVVMDALTFFSK